FCHLRIFRNLGQSVAIEIATIKFHVPIAASWVLPEYLLEQNQRLQRFLPRRLRRVPETSHTSPYTMRPLASCGDSPLPSDRDLFKQTQCECRHQPPKLIQLQHAYLLKTFQKC